MILYFRSHTAAMKAASLLSEYSISANTGKSTLKNSGCVYTVEIRTDAEKTLRILNENGMNYISGGGVKSYDRPD